MRTIFNRELISDQFLAEVADYLAGAGWALVNTGTIYGLVKISSVKNWPRISSTGISDILEAVDEKFDFAPFESLLAGDEAVPPDDDPGETS
jgi:hypothetical protein